MDLKRLLILIIIFFLSFEVNLFADNDKSDKDKYKAAEEYVAYDDFDKALELYIDLFKRNSNNYNYAYKIGYCYLTGENSQDVKSAIDYLLMATENTDKKYRNKYKENKAPIDSYYYLGVAYRLNKEYEKAIDAFNTFDQKMTKKERKTVQGMFIEREIQSCRDAMEVIDAERMKIEKILVSELEEPNVRCPILCWDANRLIFTNGKYNVFPPDINYNTEYSEGPFDGVFMADRVENGQFANPKNITNDLQIPYPFIPVTATADGTELYLIADRYDNGDIYMSKFENGKYQPAERVKKLNTRKWESHATITADGKRIYFTSLRKGGQGGLDIWYSDRDEEGKWQKPVNLGSEVNTPFHEEMPYVIRNGNALYFSSESHTNVGGFDVFYTNWDEQNKKWAAPINLGYPFSTGGNDMGYIIENTPVFAFCPVNDNKRRVGVDECDCISLVDEQAPQLAKISGVIELDPENQEKLMQVRVKLIDKDSGEEIANVKLDENGNYLIEGVEAGNYDLIAYDQSGDLMTRAIDVPQNESWDITGMDMVIEIPDLASNEDINSNDNSEESLMIENVFFDFDKYDIKPESTNNLDIIADYLKKNPEAKFNIAGHTDYYGAESYNMNLSKNRAISVQNYLLNKGVGKAQLSVEYNGEQMQITVETEDDAIRHLNRRVEFSVVKQGYPKVEVKPIIIPEEYLLP